MKIEPISAENVGSLVGLVLRLWEDCEVDEELAYYSELVSSDSDFCCLAQIEGRFVGFIHGAIRMEYVEGTDGPPVAYLEAIYVVPEFQKKGIARELYGELERWAKSKNAKQLASDTELTNATGVQFHKQLGFREVAQIVCFVKDL